MNIFPAVFRLPWQGRQGPHGAPPDGQGRNLSFKEKEGDLINLEIQPGLRRG